MTATSVTTEKVGAYRRTKRLVYVAALLMDLCFGVFLFVGPIAAFQLTKEPGLQAALGVTVLAARILFNTLFGRLSDWLGRKNLLLTSSVLMVVAFVGLTAASNLATIYALAFLVGVANALYWPVIEAWVGEEVHGIPLVRDIGSFNVAFSTGLVLAPLTSALLQQPVSGPAGQASLLRPTLLGLALAAVTFAFILLRPALSHAQIAELRRARPPLPRTSQSRRFLYAGWLANFVAWCGVGVIRFLFPGLVMGQLGLTARTLGLLQTAFYLSWAVGFVTWRSWTGWRYRRWPLLVNQTIGAAGLTCIWLAPGAWTLAIGLALFGFGMTGPYVSSIFYGLDRYTDKGTKSGLHETILAAGMLLGLGVFAALAKWVSLSLPYLVIAGAMLAVCGFHWFYLAEGDGRPDEGS